jgi:hypothetical protein
MQIFRVVFFITLIFLAGCTDKILLKKRYFKGYRVFSSYNPAIVNKIKAKKVDTFSFKDYEPDHTLLVCSSHNYKISEIKTNEKEINFLFLFNKNIIFKKEFNEKRNNKNKNPYFIQNKDISYGAVKTTKKSFFKKNIPINPQPYFFSENLSFFWVILFIIISIIVFFITYFILISILSSSEFSILLSFFLLIALIVIGILFLINSD